MKRKIIRIRAAILLLSIIFILPAINNITANEKENLGPEVNTKYDELAPIISPDGKTLYFCRQGDPANIGFEAHVNDQDIWVSQRIGDSTWSKAVNIGKPLNNLHSNAVCSVSPDGNTLLLFGAYKTDNGSIRGMSVSHKRPYGWSFPVTQAIDDFYNLSNRSNYSMSDDKKKLFMSVEREDSYGKLDLYVSFRVGNNKWKKPLNLGSQINTPGNEYSPFLAADNETLYFSSDGHNGYGGADIYMTKRLDDSWTNWSKPVNLGPSVNTEKNDYHYRIPASGDYAYFVSDDNSIGGKDIFRIKLTENKPEPVVLVYGKVVNAVTKDPVTSDIFYEILPSGKEAGIASSSPDSGYYKITLPARKKYGFRAEADGFISVNDYLDLTHLKKYAEIRRDLELIPVKKNTPYPLRNIFFDHDSSVLKVESFPVLNRLTKILEQNPAWNIEIYGHTDNTGNSSYNKKLSEDRARAVVEYLVNHGISENRLNYKGFGDTKPIGDNDTEQGRAKNRRVEFLIRD